MKVLAEEWRIPLRTVKTLTHDAGVLVHHAQVASGAEARIEETLAELDELKQRALAHEFVTLDGEGERVSFPRPDFRVALGALDAKLRVLGATARQTPKSADAVQPAAGGDDYAKLPPRERVRILEEALAVERSRADGGNNEGDGRH